MYNYKDIIDKYLKEEISEAEFEAYFDELNAKEIYTEDTRLAEKLLNAVNEDIRSKKEHDLRKTLASLSINHFEADVQTKPLTTAFKTGRRDSVLYSLKWYGAAASVLVLFGLCFYYANRNYTDRAIFETLYDGNKTSEKLAVGSEKIKDESMDLLLANDKQMKAFIDEKMGQVRTGTARKTAKKQRAITKKHEQEDEVIGVSESNKFKRDPRFINDYKPPVQILKSGLDAYFSGNIEEARKSFEKIPKNAREYPIAQYYLAYTSLNSENYDLAIESFNNILAMDSVPVHITYEIGYNKLLALVANHEVENEVFTHDMEVMMDVDNPYYNETQQLKRKLTSPWRRFFVFKGKK